MKRILAVLLTLCLCVALLAGCANYNTGEVTNIDEVAKEMQALYGENRVLKGSYDKSLAVTCNNGTFVGSEKNGVLSFKGIPYAEVPVGDLRWKDPVDAKDSDVVREALYYGDSAIQSDAESEVASYYPQSEDCLNLNVWVNTKNKSQNKTVMVFFHGGSYGWGGTVDPLYDGQNLVEKYDDLILVTVDYRVGFMGFVDFSSVPGGEDFKTSGNLGLLDQVSSLRWVQRNIAKFGGDPENVTIFGESAGGGSVSLLPLIDGTEGLFARVIAESGSIALSFAKEECQSQTEQLLEESGCKTMDDLMALSTEKLQAVMDVISDNNTFPERDGVVLPEDLYKAYADGEAANVDMMVGTNADEARYWINEMGYSTDKLDGYTIYRIGMPIMLENNLKAVSDEDMQYIDRFMDLQTDEKVWNITEFYNEMLFRLPALAQAESNSKNGGRAYVYYWSYPSAYDLIGACHAVELAYVFNNLDETIYTGDNIDKDLADATQDMWVNFARTGDPSTEAYKWDTYDTETRKTMVLDKDIHMESDLLSEQRKALEPILKYHFNGCYSQLSVNVPTIRKAVAAVVLVLAALIAAIVFAVRRHRKKEQ